MRILAFRLLGTIPVLLSLVLLVLVLQHISPYDPARALAGERAPDNVVQRFRDELRLDEPLPIQYIHYLGRTVRGDLGKSAISGRPVTSDLARHLPATLELVIAASIIAIILGVALAMISVRPGWGPKLARAVMIGGASVPVFLAAFAGLLIFYRRLGWLPLTGRSSISSVPDGPTGFYVFDGLVRGRLDVVADALHHLVLPASVLAIGPAVAIGRVLRSGLYHALRSDYVRTARSKGLSEAAVVRRHALRNSSIAALSMGGMQIAAMFGIGIVIEVIFAWPGLGTYLERAISRGDFTSIGAVTLVLGVVYVLANAVVDVLQLLVDPRMRR